MTNPLLQVEELSVGFKTGSSFRMAISNLSLTIQKGRTLGLVGESGSGKSITSLAIMGLLPLNAEVRHGKIFFSRNESEQENLLAQPEVVLQKIRGNDISMIFQEPMTSLNPAYRCGYQVVEVIHKHLGLSRRDSKQKALEWFERVKLPRPKELLRAYPHELSGGQRQRVMIAMAMSCNPLLLIADEPTTALDVTVQKSVLRLIRDLQQEYGTGVLFITHDLGVINEVADDLMVMYKGEAIEQGKVGEVLQSPSKNYTRALLGSRPPVDRRLTALPVMKDFMGGSAIDFSGLIEKRTIPKKERVERQTKYYQQDPILKIRKLTTNFVTKANFLGKPTDHFTAVDAIDLQLFPGETLGLVGESGCGKTTLGRTVLQLVEKSSGEIWYRGKRLDEWKKEQKEFRRKIQIIFQDPYSSLNPRLTVGEAILEPMTVHKLYGSKAERKDKVKELLDQVGLDQSSFGRYPHEFSGGQRQRIGIARALALEPEIIICDESVSALDMSVQAQVLNLLNDLKKTLGLTYLFISHDLSVVKYMSDRIVVMRNGKIEESGDADELYDHPSSPYTKELIASIPRPF